MSREADLDQFARGDAPCAVRGERTVAVERVVDIDDTSLLVCGDRNAAAHVGHDQIRLFVHPAHPFAVETRRGLLVQGVEDRFARAHRHARDACRVVHLVDHRRVGDVGLDTRHVGDLCGQQSSEVAGVFHLRVPQIVAHARIDFVDSCGNGAYQSAAADHRREVSDVERLFAERRKDQSAAPVQLVVHAGEAGDFLGGVTEVQFQQRPLLVVEGDLCRR